MKWSRAGNWRKQGFYVMFQCQLSQGPQWPMIAAKWREDEWQRYAQSEACIKRNRNQGNKGSGAVGGLATQNFIISELIRGLHLNL